MEIQPEIAAIEKRLADDAQGLTLVLVSVTQLAMCVHYVCS